MVKGVAEIPEIQVDLLPGNWANSTVRMARLLAEFEQFTLDRETTSIRSP